MKGSPQQEVLSAHPSGWHSLLCSNIHPGPFPCSVSTISNNIYYKEIS